MKDNMVDFIKGNRDYFEDFITRSTYHSNSIEGNTLSYGETYAILWNDNSFKINTTPRELYEAINHKYALSFAMDHLDEGLSKNLICHIAELINKNIDEISGYRTGQVFIRGAEHIPPRPEEVPQAMMYLLYNTEKTVYESPYEKAAQFHVDFERIHPFSDGNGRTGRILVNYLLLRDNMVPIVIEKDDRSEYFKLLSDRDVAGMTRFFEQLGEREQERIKFFVKDHDKNHNLEKVFGCKIHTGFEEKEREKSSDLNEKRNMLPPVLEQDGPDIE